jgi:hypothetical protein
MRAAASLGTSSAACRCVGVGPRGACRIARSTCIRQHTSAYVSIRQHTSAYVGIRQHTSAKRQHTSAYVGIRQHTSAYVSIRQHTSAYVSIRQHLSYIFFNFFGEKKENWGGGGDKCLLLLRCKALSCVDVGGPRTSKVRLRASEVSVRM